MPPRRKFTKRERISGVRDAKLIVIVSEGSKTEPKYFSEMASQKYYYNSRVKVHILEKEDKTASSPEHVLHELDKFQEEFILEEGDELWLVIDHDNWGNEKLSTVATLCQQKDYQLAISNPCFEIWLLLHLRSLDEYSQETLDEFRNNLRGESNRTPLERELLNILGEYNKSNLNVEHFLPDADKAIERAQELDVHPEHRWPNDLGSRVYLVAQKIIGT